VPLALATEPAGDPTSATLRVSGELDLATAPGLRAAVGDLMGQGVRHLVLDLEGCTFLDSTGMGALLWASHRLQSAGGEVAVAHVRGAPARTLSVSGVDRAMAVRA
jgi:anti-sigma B factor antagonist